MWASEIHHPEGLDRPSRLAAMRGARARAVLAAAMFAALVAISGCGGSVGDGGIPQETADSMLALTQQIEDANASRDCDTASRATTELRAEVDSLEGGETKQALDAMVTQLDENIDADCVPEGASGEANAKPEEQEEPTTSVPVEPEPTVPTTTTTTETTAPPPEEEPPEPEQPPHEDGGPNGPPQTPPGQAGGGPPTGGVEE